MHENTLRAIRREMMQVLRGCAKALLSARRVTRPAPPGVGPFFEGSGGWSWAQAAVAIDPPKSVRGCVATSVSPTPAIAPTKMREVLRMDQQAFVIFTSVAPTALLWPPFSLSGLWLLPRTTSQVRFTDKRRLDEHPIPSLNGYCGALLLRAFRIVAGLWSRG